jgi:hypothetical protein
MWHTHQCGRPDIWKIVCAAMRCADRRVLTWLANCVRRILSKLMIAVAEEWRGERWWRYLRIFDARQEMEVGR